MNDINKGHIFFILGTSGSGKGTLIHNIKNSFLSNSLFPMSYTSRSRRDNEGTSVLYNFISKSEFEAMISDNKFIEYNKNYGHTYYYGTGYDDVVTNGIDKGKIIFKELDSEGFNKIITNFPEIKKNITTIFLSLDPNEFKNRLKSRGEENMCPEAFEKRLNYFKKEIDFAEKNCDYIIDTTNITSDQVFEKALNIIKKTTKI